MCGRYQAWVDDEDILRIIEREKKGNISRYFRQDEVFSGSILPILYASPFTVRAKLSKWGCMITTESDGKTKSTRLINARAESAPHKPMFKDVVRNKRTLVVTSGYYEWSADRRKWHITNGGVMLLAGLDISDCADEDSHVVITTAARGEIRTIHHRMPLVIEKDEMKAWLYDENFARRKLASPGPADFDIREVG